MQANQDTINLVEHYEGLKLSAYPDPATKAEPYTIGYGTTVYPNGNRVKLGDKITATQAVLYFINDINQRIDRISKHLTVQLNSNQLGALASFDYNEGDGNLFNSTLLKKVNNNPHDSSIYQEFIKWDMAAGHVMDGLLQRRNAEYQLYIKPI